MGKLNVADWCGVFHATNNFVEMKTKEQVIERLNHCYQNLQEMVEANMLINRCVDEEDMNAIYGEINILKWMLDDE